MRRRTTQQPKKEIFINTTISETRIAILEDGNLIDLFIELPENERSVGDIYLGRVVNVVRGMRAAFVDIGQGQDAFLHFSDIGDSLAEYGAYLDLETATSETPKNNRRPIPREGQEILVQIIKEPISSKGSRITTELSLAGRFFVLVPYSEMIGVSRKVSNAKEKRRLRDLARSWRPKGFGVIIRTVAESKDEDLLRADFENLIKKWRQIEKKLKTLRPPSLAHKDLAMASTVIRDLFTNDVTRVVIDDARQYKSISQYLKEVSPNLLPKLEMYKGKRPIFDTYGIEQEVEKSMSRKVWLKSGGHLIFDHTEALVAVDVNSGKFIGRAGHDENSLRINLEAAREIARQLRLRDIGGIIVIDFIDMIDPKNKRTLYNEFQKELKRDRAQANISPISEFGLIEMTRERIRPSLLHSYSEMCHTCEGTGRIMSKASVLTKVERTIKRIKAISDEKNLKLEVHPEVADMLTNGLRSHIRRMMWKYWLRIDVIGKDSFKFDEIHCISRRTNKEIVLN
ncbi:MAG: Rne/Rng family ribonuclease [Deferribacteres bacterium]|nr:Rne/Rng family ribonuclease [candidate division KSB1 bacterium]MCB9511344.1 Rne/Rng family ribonuclease [Deferribacteres bacterium]